MFLSHPFHREQVHGQPDGHYNIWEKLSRSWKLTACIERIKAPMGFSSLRPSISSNSLTCAKANVRMMSWFWNSPCNTYVRVNVLSMEFGTRLLPFAIIPTPSPKSCLPPASAPINFPQGHALLLKFPSAVRAESVMISAHVATWQPGENNDRLKIVAYPCELSINGECTLKISR